MSQLLVIAGEHTGYVLERRREYSFAAQSAREPIDRLLVHLRVRVVRRIFRWLQSTSVSNE
jgi:hypothetical protein